jgi:hypothetical protein
LPRDRKRQEASGDAGTRQVVTREGLGPTQPKLIFATGDARTRQDETSRRHGVGTLEGRLQEKIPHALSPFAFSASVGHNNSGSATPSSEQAHVVVFRRSCLADVRRATCWISSLPSSPASPGQTLLGAALAWLDAWWSAHEILEPKYAKGSITGMDLDWVKPTLELIRRSCAGRGSPGGASKRGGGDANN